MENNLEYLRRYKIVIFIHDPNKPTGSCSPDAVYVHFINMVIEVENGLLFREKYFEKEEEARKYYRLEIEKKVKNNERYSCWPYIALVDTHHLISHIPFTTDEIIESHSGETR